MVGNFIVGIVPSHFTISYSLFALKSVVASSKTFADKRDALIKELTDNLRAATAEGVNSLKSMNLPGALEAVVPTGAVPQVLLDDSDAVRKAGGVDGAASKLEVRARVRDRESSGNKSGKSIRKIPRYGKGGRTIVCLVH